MDMVTRGVTGKPAGFRTFFVTLNLFQGPSINADEGLKF